MNPNGIKFLFDSEFRDRYIHDSSFWIILFGLSYFVLIVFARNWTIKNFKTLLWTAVLIALIGDIFGFIIYKTGTPLGALNGPLISLLSYRLLYDWFNKKYNKPPASPFATFWSNDWSLMEDGLLNFVFALVSTFSTALLALLTINL